MIEQREASILSERWNRIAANDDQNIPYALSQFAVAVFGLIAVGYTGLGVWITVSVCIYAWVFSRFAHTFVYLYSMQPWRTLLWFTTILTQWGAIFTAYITVMVYLY